MVLGARQSSHYIPTLFPCNSHTVLAFSRLEFGRGCGVPFEFSALQFPTLVRYVGTEVFKRVQFEQHVCRVLGSWRASLFPVGPFVLFASFIFLNDFFIYFQFQKWIIGALGCKLLPGAVGWVQKIATYLEVEVHSWCCDFIGVKHSWGT